MYRILNGLSLDIMQEILKLKLTIMLVMRPYFPHKISKQLDMD